MPPSMREKCPSGFQGIFDDGARDAAVFSTSPISWFSKYCNPPTIRQSSLVNRQLHRMQKLSITWFGHSTFLLRTPGGKRLLFDPWLRENPRSEEHTSELQSQSNLVC